MNVRENSFSQTRQNLYLHCKTSCPLGDGGRAEILGAGQEHKVVRQGFVLDSTHFSVRQNMVSQSDNIWQKYELGIFFFLLFYFSHSKLPLRPVPPCAVSQSPTPGSRTKHELPLPTSLEKDRLCQPSPEIFLLSLVQLVKNCLNTYTVENSCVFSEHSI